MDFQVVTIKLRSGPAENLQVVQDIASQCSLTPSTPSRRLKLEPLCLNTTKLIPHLSRCRISLHLDTRLQPCSRHLRPVNLPIRQGKLFAQIRSCWSNRNTFRESSPEHRCPCRHSKPPVCRPISGCQGCTDACLRCQWRADLWECYVAILCYC